MAYKAMQMKERLLNDKNREPTIEEIATEMGVNKESVVLALEAVIEPISLNEPAFSDNNDTVYVMDQVGNNDSELNWIEELFIKQVIKSLNDKERNILKWRFLKGKTQTEVAVEMGISQAQVSRLEKSAMKKIKGKWNYRTYVRLRKSDNF